MSASGSAASSGAGSAAGKSGRPARRSTVTSRFGSGRREGHDASVFYERFVAPEVSDDSTVNPAGDVDVIYASSATEMTAVASDSVALVVTSPPYFAGKAYEESLGTNGVPGSYFEYLQLLRDVFSECKRVLEPGGRIAINVANLGRRPYRSLAGDVTTILGDLGLLLRGEVVWWKGRAAGGSCAWGTFQRPHNPVLRDVTERVVIASKGRFDRALDPKTRLALDHPSVATISKEEFMEATTDLWEIAPESATRVGHPAPFPVELPRRLIDLYTYQGDVVLDPFMGSGTTAIAAIKTGRHYLGFDTDEDYVLRAKERIEAERIRLASAPIESEMGVSLPAAASTRRAKKGRVETDPVAEGVREGLAAKEIAVRLLEGCGFSDVRPSWKPRGLGIEIDLLATDATGRDWAFDICGSFTVTQAGLRRTDTLFKALGQAAVLHQLPAAPPLVLLTTDVPLKTSAGAKALRAVQGPGRPVFDVVVLLDPADHDRLRAAARGEAFGEGPAGEPGPAGGQAPAGRPASVGRQASAGGQAPVGRPAPAGRRGPAGR
jgi:DNA modification methylase